MSTRPEPEAQRADERTYSLHDAQYNITAVTDESGVVLVRFVYDPYGTRRSYDAAWQAIRGDFDADGDLDQLVGWVVLSV